MSKETKKKKQDSFRFLDGWLFARMLRSGAARLSDKADTVNNLNVFPVPDGDTGDNMRMTIEGGVAALDGQDSGNLAEVSQALSKGMLLGARGNSGVILSQFFAGVGRGLASCEKADAQTMGAALREGVKQAYASVLTPMEGTILTVAREAVDYAVSRLTSKSTIRTLFADLEKEMKASLARTPDLLEALKEAGVIDSGGAGLLYIVEGINKILQGEEVKSGRHTRQADKPKQPVALGTFGPDSVMEYGYCTELLLQLQNSKTNIEQFDMQPVTEFLQSVGDSIVAFKSDSIVKIHVHTMTPEKVLAFCRQYGEFLNVKIENIDKQVSLADLKSTLMTFASEYFGQRSASSTVTSPSTAGTSGMGGLGRCSSVFNSAARSRATPQWESQSGRLGVTEQSYTTSESSISPRGTPIFVSGGRIIKPS